MQDELLNKLQAARSLAERKWPYISAILFNLRLVRLERSDFKTLGVDKGWRLYWSPEFVDKCELDELATGLLHESLHCLMDHSRRFEDLTGVQKDHNIWNIAGDCSINQILDDARAPFPKHFKPVRFSDMKADVGPHLSTEQTYVRLLESGYAPPNNPQPQAPSPGGDEHDADSGDPGETGDQPDNSDMGQGEGSLADLGGELTPNCGSGAGGPSQDYELDDADTDFQAATEAEKSINIAQVSSAILETNSWGAKPSKSLVRVVEDLQKPKVSWRRELAVVLRQNIGTTMGRKDYTMMRLSRREHALKSKSFAPRLPALRAPLPPNVCVILDTSPSISEENLRDGLTEILGIVRAIGNSKSVAVIPCSGKAYPVQFVRSANKVNNLKTPGDNTTDLRRGFEAAMALKNKPEIIVVMTDGYTPWPKEKPRGVGLVLVLLTEESQAIALMDWMKPIILGV
jgi:predicted metal-dependent peptidase